MAYVAICLLAATGFSDPLREGDPFPVLDGADQHGERYSVGDAHHVLVSFDMAPGKKANVFFEKQGANYLPSTRSVFVANIHGMPAVGRFFAIPKMQKYPHRILLADKEGLLDDLPQQKGKVTVFVLDAERRVESISFWDPAAGDEPF